MGTKKKVSSTVVTFVTVARDPNIANKKRAAF